ncbi:MAG: hypothetical protein MZU97_19065 [Bacillus subtilis]|nr:hypothetical protein [Bacillus subtilis]
MIQVIQTMPHKTLQASGTRPARRQTRPRRRRRPRSRSRPDTAKLVFLASDTAPSTTKRITDKTDDRIKSLLIRVFTSEQLIQSHRQGRTKSPGGGGPLRLSDSSKRP